MSISVNDAIDRLNELNGKGVVIYGALSLKFEGQCITHVPGYEQRENLEGDSYYYGSSIWINLDLKKMGISEEILEQFDEREVILSGILRGPEPGSGGCGHFSLWPAEMDVSKVEKRALEA